MLSCTHKKQHMYCLPYINCESLGLNSSLPCNVWSNFWDVLLVYGIGNTTLAKSSSFLPNQSTCTPFTWKCQTRNPLCTTPTYRRSLGEVREGRICESRWDPSRTNTSDVVRWHQCGRTKSFGLWPLYQHHRTSNEGSYQDISIYQPCLGLQTLWVAKANSWRSGTRPQKDAQYNAKKQHQQP